MEFGISQQVQQIYPKNTDPKFSFDASTVELRLEAGGAVDDELAKLKGKQAVNETDREKTHEFNKGGRGRFFFLNELGVLVFVLMLVCLEESSSCTSSL